MLRSSRSAAATVPPASVSRRAFRRSLRSGRRGERQSRPHRLTGLSCRGVRPRRASRWADFLGGADWWADLVGVRPRREQLGFSSSVSSIISSSVPSITHRRMGRFPRGLRPRRRRPRRRRPRFPARVPTRTAARARTRARAHTHTHTQPLRDFFRAGSRPAISFGPVRAHAGLCARVRASARAHTHTRTHTGASWRWRWAWRLSESSSSLTPTWRCFAPAGARPRGRARSS